MKVQLYHGTSLRNADSIMRHGFKDRVGAGKSNWKGKITSQAGYVYLSSAYVFYFAMAAAKGRKASVIKVEVDTDDLYPDEDLLHFVGLEESSYRDKLHLFKHAAERSLNELGNVAIRADSPIKILGRKDFDTHEMWRWSDPSISPMNYAILGKYYRTLTDTWFDGGDWQSLDHGGFLGQS